MDTRVTGTTSKPVSPVRATREEAAIEAPSKVSVKRDENGISEITVEYGQYKNPTNRCAPGSAFIHLGYGTGKPPEYPNCSNGPEVLTVTEKINLKKGLITYEMGFAALRNSGPDGHKVYQSTCLNHAKEIDAYISKNRSSLSQEQVKDLREAQRLLMAESKKPYSEQSKTASQPVSPVRATREEAAAEAPSKVSVKKVGNSISEITIEYGQYRDPHGYPPGSAFIHAGYGGGETAPSHSYGPADRTAMHKIDLKNGLITWEEGMAALRNSGPDGHKVYQDTCLDHAKEIDAYISKNRSSLSQEQVNDLRAAQSLLLAESKKPYKEQ